MSAASRWFFNGRQTAYEQRLRDWIYKMGEPVPDSGGTGPGPGGTGSPFPAQGTLTDISSRL